MNINTQNLVYLLIGGNLGDRKQLLIQAVDLLKDKLGDIVALSSIYETAAWGNEEQAAFLNQALIVSTDNDADAVLKIIQEIEILLGRHRVEKWGSRSMDIDIIFFNQDIVQQKGLTIPHPFMEKRNFVLFPMAEIAGKYIHPILKMDVNTLFNNSQDPLEVSKI